MATHYTEDQKNHWRRFVMDLADFAAADEREFCSMVPLHLAMEGRIDPHTAEIVEDAIKARGT